MNATHFCLLLGLAACAGCIPTGGASGDGQKAAAAPESPQAAGGQAAAVRPSDASAAPSPKAGKEGAPKTPAPGGGKPAAQPGATATAAGGDEDQDKEIKALQGTWVETKFISRGEESPPGRQRATLVFKNQTMTTKVVTEGQPGDDTDTATQDRVDKTESTFTLDLSKKPKRIIETPKGTNDAAPIMYELKGNTLKIIRLEFVLNPPSDLSGKDSGSIVEIYTKK